MDIDTSFLIEIGIDPKKWQELVAKFNKLEDSITVLKAKFKDIKTGDIVYINKQVFICKYL